MKRILGGVFLLSAATAVQPAPPGAASAPGLLRLAARADQARISPAEAAQKARRQHGGKVLSVSLQHNGDRPYYRVKLLDNGSVRIVRVPAN